MQCVFVVFLVASFWNVVLYRAVKELFWEALIGHLDYTCLTHLSCAVAFYPRICSTSVSGIGVLPADMKDFSLPAITTELSCTTELS